MAQAMTYQQIFDQTAQRIQALDDRALVAAAPAAQNTFLQTNALGLPGNSAYQDAIGALPNILNYGESDYAKLNHYEPLCLIGDNLVVGNYTGYRDITGADIALYSASFGLVNGATKIKLLQSYVVCALPYKVMYLEVIYRKSHLGMPKILPAACEYHINEVFDQQFIVLGPQDKQLEVQQLLSPDVQASLLDYPRNIGIGNGFLVTTFGGYFYDLQAPRPIPGQQAGEVRNQIMDSFLIYQQFLEQIDGRYKVQNGYTLVRLQAIQTLSLKSNRRKRIIAGTASALIIVILIIACLIWASTWH